MKSASLFSTSKICLSIYFTLFQKTINKYAIHCDGNHCNKEALKKNSIIEKNEKKIYNKLTEVTIKII